MKSRGQVKISANQKKDKRDPKTQRKGPNGRKIERDRANKKEREGGRAIQVQSRGDLDCFRIEPAFLPMITVTSYPPSAGTLLLGRQTLLGTLPACEPEQEALSALPYAILRPANNCLCDMLASHIPELRPERQIRLVCIFS